MMGATHSFNDEAVDLRIADHAANLSRLREISPALAKSMNIDSLDIRQLGGRASVRASLPGALPLVGKLLPGLYTSLGHGTRGLITAGLSGRIDRGGRMRAVVALANIYSECTISRQEIYRWAT